MGCDVKRLPDGSTAIVCRRRGSPPAGTPLCQAPLCITPSTRSCDWPVGDGKTCDERMCDRHAYRPKEAKNYDLCPRHAAEFKLGRKEVT